MAYPKGVSAIRPPRHPLYRVAMAVDWQGPHDDQLALLFAGAEMEWLKQIFTTMCGSSCGLARGFTIEMQRHPVQRNGYVNEYVAVVLEDRREQLMSVEGLMTIVARQLERQMNGGRVDVYDLDQFMNLHRRRTDKKNETINKSEMANIYLRVPWYVAAWLRGREEDNQLTEWDAVEFADYTHEQMVLENNLRLLPEQVQSHNCYSQRAWQNILHGKHPDGGNVILRRDPTEWPNGKEICTLIGMAYHGKQAGSEYVAIRMPREVYINKHVYRTNAGYCLSYDVGAMLSSMLTRKFCYEYLEWTEFDKEFARRQGVKRKTIDTVERFFVQFNFPVAIQPTERESLRRMHTRWLANARKRPTFHYQFDDQSFLQHISDDDRRRAEDRARRRKD